MMMNNRFMNLPEFHTVTDQDIVEEYYKYNDIKKVAKIFDLSVQNVKDVLKAER
ncbi:hypothetical protein [[Ruminococcus] torques]|uniref:hypothetical protein n=1 Tax=[Ruminococcus] torques TaxID=33039 RepID=UPI00402A7F93